jgi:neutral ceramidase
MNGDAVRPGRRRSGPGTKRSTLLASAMLATACHTSELLPPTLPPPTSAHVPARVLRVGAARADVTPPPGVSLFGHGPEGRVADGYWSRIYCRAFAFLPDQNTPLVIVTCDLSAIGTLLQRSVADELVERGVNIPASRLMLTATHSHAAPGHYFEGDFYGGFMSTRVPGYDPAMLKFMTTRIAGAVQDAVKSATVARLSWAHTSTWDFTRNRSLTPFRQNNPAFSPDSACSAGPPARDLLPDERAIDPCLDVLAIEALDDHGAPAGAIGSISFFAMHPTVLPDTNRLVGADVDGVVSRAMERRMRQEFYRQHPGQRLAHDPVHAIVNTNEGDMSPRWSSGTTEEAVAIGERLAERIWQALRNEAKTTVPVIDARYVQVHLPSARLFDGSHALCDVPELGVAVPQGASDHPTALRIIGDFRDENVDLGNTDDCSAPRRPFLDFIQRAASGSGSFPEDVPLALAQVGDTLLSFVPAEMTITAGNRLARDVAREALGDGLGASRSLVAGLANGYIQYVTTAEEYRLQHYEGASNIYGIWTERYLAERYALLARAMAGKDVAPWLPDIDRVKPYPYVTSSERARLSTGKGETPLTTIAGRGIQGLCRLPSDEFSVCVSWKDGAPGVVPPVDGEPWIHLVDDTGAAVFDPSDPTCPIDDRGLEFQTRVHDSDGDGYTWTTVFSPSASSRAAIGTRRIHLRVGSGSTALASRDFALADPLSPCTWEQVIHCAVGR